MLISVDFFITGTSRYAQRPLYFRIYNKSDCFTENFCNFATVVRNTVLKEYSTAHHANDLICNVKSEPDSLLCIGITLEI